MVTLMFTTMDTRMRTRREVTDTVTVDMDTATVDMDIVMVNRRSQQPRREQNTEPISMPTGTMMMSTITPHPCPPSGSMP